MEVRIDTSTPTHFNTFSDYWKHIQYYKPLERKWLPWRLKHKNYWKTMNNTTLWWNLLFLSSPLFPRKLAHYILFKMSKKAQKKVEKSLVDYISGQIDKEITEEIIKKIHFNNGTGEVIIDKNYL